MRRLNLLSLNLLDDNANINGSARGYRRRRDRLSPLARAVESGNYPLVKALLARGADARQKDRYGNSVMMSYAFWYYPAYGRSLRIIRLLLKHGASVNQDHGDWGYGLTTVAVAERDALLLSFCLKKGGDPRWEFGVKSFAETVDRSSNWIIEMLLPSAVKAAWESEGGWMPGSTSLMTVGPYPNVVRQLLEQGEDINAADVVGMTALMYYAVMGDIESVQLLLDAGADVNATDYNGSTALNYARMRESEQEEFANLLLHHGAPDGAEAKREIITDMTAEQWDEIHAMIPYRWRDAIKRFQETNRIHSSGATKLIFAHRRQRSPASSEPCKSDEEYLADARAAINGKIRAIDGMVDVDSRGWMIRLHTIVEGPSAHHPQYTPVPLCVLRGGQELIATAAEYAAELASEIGVDSYVQAGIGVRWWDTQE